MDPPNPRALCVRNAVLQIKANALSLGSFYNLRRELLVKKLRYL